MRFPFTEFSIALYVDHCYLDMFETGSKHTQWFGQRLCTSENLSFNCWSFKYLPYLHRFQIILCRQLKFFCYQWQQSFTSHTCVHLSDSNALFTILIKEFKRMRYSVLYCCAQQYVVHNVKHTGHSCFIPSL